ncbi:hypothetical protein ACTFIR_010448 [Dictyostelium discoideum]
MIEINNNHNNGNGKQFPSSQIMPDSKKKSIVKIGEYTLGEKIGRGAFGQVFKGLNGKTGEFAAIKQIDSNKIDESSLQSVKGEVEILHKLRHNNIVKVLGVVEVQAQLNFILEYVENGSLRDVIEKFGPLSEELCIIYLYQMLQGLAYLHSNKVIHRDIKASNILITKEGVIKLADFGVASQIDSESQLRFSVVGTPFWMAPESIEISGCSSACDIWSLGSTMIELLTGNPPYYTLQPMAAMFRIVSDQHPPFPTDISKEFLDYFQQSFKKDPTQRPTAQELLQHPIFFTLQKVPPTLSELQSTLKTLNGGRSRLRTSVNSIDWGSSSSTSGSSTPLSSSSSSSNIKSIVSDEDFNKLQTTIKQQAQTISNLSEEILILKKELKEKPKLEEQQFYKEYFMALAISVKVNQCYQDKTCEPKDMQQLYEMARSQEIPWYKLIEWIPSQLISKDNIPQLTPSSSRENISLSNSSSSIPNPNQNQNQNQNNKSKPKKFGFFS